MSLPITFAFDFDLMGVVRQSIEGALSQDRVVEQRDPFLDAPVTGEDRRGSLVPLDDQLVEVARLDRVEAAETEIVEDEDVGRDEFSQELAGARVRAGLVELAEEVIDTDSEDVPPRPAGGVSQGRGEMTFPDADRAHKDHILVLLEESQREEMLDAIAVEGDRSVPVEVFESLLLGESGLLESEP